MILCHSGLVFIGDPILLYFIILHWVLFDCHENGGKLDKDTFFEE
jgi:hypothetical protein